MWTRRAGTGGAVSLSSTCLVTCVYNWFEIQVCETFILVFSCFAISLKDLPAPNG
jgi:hypothetical protein